MRCFTRGPTSKAASPHVKCLNSRGTSQHPEHQQQQRSWRPCGDWRLNTSSRTLGADTLAPAYQDGDTPRKETFSSRDDAEGGWRSLAGCERAGHSSPEDQILTVGRTGAERRQACAARWDSVRRSRIGALEARSPSLDGRVVREPRRASRLAAKRKIAPPHQRTRDATLGDGSEGQCGSELASCAPRRPQMLTGARLQPADTTNKRPMTSLRARSPRAQPPTSTEYRPAA